MKQQYYFGINGKSVGPLNEQEIRQKVREHSITGETPVWCPGMADWCNMGDIPELTAEFSDQLSSSVTPPALPGKENSGVKTPPPLPSMTKSSLEQGGINDQAYRFVMWGFRPFGGRSNFIRDYVHKNPQRALPIAVFTIAWIVMCFVGTILIFTKNSQMTTTPGQEIQQPAGVVGADWQQIYREGRAVQQYQQQLQDDSYRYRRDSEDRRDDAYRRATYDWMRNDD